MATTKTDEKIQMAFEGLVPAVPVVGGIPLESLPVANIAGWADAVDPEFVSSIRLFGMINPICVAPDNDPAAHPGQYVVVAGKRRLAAARKLSLEYVQCYVIDAGATAQAQVTLIENNQRKVNPYAEYKALRQLLDEGYTVEQVAKSTGIPIQTLRKRQAFDGLSEGLVQRLEDGEISPTIAAEAAKLPDEVQQVMVTEKAGKRITLDTIREYRGARRQAAIAGQLEIDISTAMVDTPESWTLRFQRMMQDLIQSAPAGVPDMLMNACAAVQTAVTMYAKSLAPQESPHAEE